MLRPRRESARHPPGCDGRSPVDFRRAMLTRPRVQVIDMILDKPAMTPEDRPLSCTPEPLQKTARHLEVGSGLVGVEDGRAALGAVRSRAFIVIVHGAGILLAVIARCDPGTRLAAQIGKAAGRERGG